MYLCIYSCAAETDDQRNWQPSYSYLVHSADLKSESKIKSDQDCRCSTMMEKWWKWWCMSTMSTMSTSKFRLFHRHGELWQARPSGPRSLDAHHVCWWIPGCVRSLFAAHRRRVAEQVGFLSLCSHRSRNHPHETKSSKKIHNWYDKRIQNATGSSAIVHF